MTPIRVIDIGLTPYRDAWALQERLHAEVFAGADSALVFCEHPHVYSLGRQTGKAHVPYDAGYYSRLGAEVVETDRGGSVTYHGPGQLVAYPIFRLRDFTCGEDLHKFLRSLEQAVIDTLAGYSIPATRDPGKTGVWTSRGKIAAIGLKCSRWITMHGLALNVNPDLSMFSHVVPCGLTEPVASMAQFIGSPPPEAPLRRALLDALCHELAATAQPTA
jgi:lipoyl(octanoyl) transferase